MAFLRRFAPVLVFTVLLAACGEDDPTQPADVVTIADFVGSWTATSLVYTNNADAGETFDLVAAGGEARFTMLDGGGTRTWIELGTFSDEWDSAASLQGDNIVMDPVEVGRETRVWAYTLVNGVLTVTDTDSEFDFTLSDAPPVSATEVVVFVRN
jgi:hypothetical protein